MTKEQAKFLYSIADNMGTTGIEYFSCKDGKKMREIIKALEQQSSEDCVDRNHVIATISQHHFDKDKDNFDLLIHNLCKEVKELPPVTPTQKWTPLVWDEYSTVDSYGNDDYVYAVDYSVPMPKEDEWVLITDENHNVVSVQYDGYDFGDYARKNILAWQPLPQPYEEK